MECVWRRGQASSAANLWIEAAFVRLFLKLGPQPRAAVRHLRGHRQLGQRHGKRAHFEDRAHRRVDVPLAIAVLANANVGFFVYSSRHVRRGRVNNIVSAIPGATALEKRQLEGIQRWHDGNQISGHLRMRSASLHLDALPYRRHVVLLVNKDTKAKLQKRIYHFPRELDPDLVEMRLERALELDSLTASLEHEASCEQLPLQNGSSSRDGRMTFEEILQRVHLDVVEPPLALPLARTDAQRGCGAYKVPRTPRSSLARTGAAQF